MITSDVCRGGPLHPREAWSDITRRLVVLPPARLKHPRPDLKLDGDVPEYSPPGLVDGVFRSLNALSIT